MTNVILKCAALIACGASAMRAQTWNQTLISTDTGTFEQYINGALTSTGQTVSGHSPFAYTANVSVGGSTDPFSGGDNCTYPVGDPNGAGSLTGGSGNPPWWHNGSMDLTGYYPNRPPQRGMRSVQHSGVRGLWFEGTMGGSATLSGTGTTLTEAVFFHQQECYAGYSEYGFYRDMSNSGIIVFYWAANANCGSLYCQANETGGSIVYEDSPTLGTPAASTVINYATYGSLGNIPSSDQIKLYAYVFQDTDTYYKFKVFVEDVTTSTILANEVIVDPNLSTHGTRIYWYPSQNLDGTAAYISLATEWNDPFNCGGGSSSCISASSVSMAATKVQYAN